MTEVYVDPSLAANTGDGSLGLPYGDLQYALDQRSHDTANGTRFNIKAGAAEVLTATLSFTAYGTTTFTATAPLVFQGYTAAAGDGGVGEIDANGNSIISFSTMDHVCVIHMNCHNSGSADLFALDTGSKFIGCKLHDCDNHVLDLDGSDYVINCHIYDFEGDAIQARGSGLVAYNWIESRTTSAANGAQGLYSDNGNKAIVGNVIWLRGPAPTGRAIVVGGGDKVLNNTLRSNESGTKSTASGIEAESTSSTDIFIASNIISGFDRPIEINGGGNNHIAILNNLYWDNTTNAIIAVKVALEEGNTVPGSDPFTAKASGDFTPSSSFKAGAFPGAYPHGSLTSYLDQGAIQREEPAPGGSSVFPVLPIHHGL